MAMVKRGLGAATADGATLVAAGVVRVKAITVSVGATARWLKFYDKATAPLSSDTPILSVYCPVGTTTVPLPGEGIVTALGFGFRAAALGADNDVTYTSFAAADSAINVAYDLGN